MWRELPRASGVRLAGSEAARIVPRTRGIMASFELLDRAADEFETRLRLVTDAQRTLPTPCDKWNVRDLVTHQTKGMRLYTLLLHGATGEAA
jgi:Mycothiol maleylpyruvate isomerase N-terminal domain